MESVADKEQEVKDPPAEVPSSEPAEQVNPAPHVEPSNLAEPEKPAEVHQPADVPDSIPPQQISEEVLQRPLTPAQSRQILSENRSAPGSPTVFISLKSDTACRSPMHLEIADSLYERKLQKEAKISKMRVQKKANEIGQLQNVPTINKKSKKLASSQISTQPMPGKNGKVNEASSKNEKSSEDSFLQLIPESPKSTNQSLKAKANQEHAVFLNTDLIKSAVKLRENLPEKKEKQLAKKMSLTQRGKITKEKKFKKIKEAEEVRKVKELEGCTFKPKILSGKNMVSESGTCIIKRSNSGSILKNELGSPSSPRANKAVLEFFDNFQLSEPKTYGFMYSQMSPVNYNLRYKHGFNSGVIESKSRPMVDYRIVGSNLLE